MSVFLAQGRMAVHHENDPKEELLRKLGDLSKIELFGNWILAAVYTMPENAKTKSGLLIPQKTKDEGLWQSRSVLVVKVGPQAFVDDENTQFHGQSVSAGDWALVRPADGQSVEIHGVLCRLYRDTQIIAKIPDPDCVW